MVEILLDGRRAGIRVGHRRIETQRHRLGESVEARAAVEQRGAADAQLVREKVPEAREARDLDDGAAADVENSDAQMRVRRHDHRAVDGAEALPVVGEHMLLQRHGAVAEQVDAVLHQSHHRHHVDGGLNETVAKPDGCIS